MRAQEAAIPIPQYEDFDLHIVQRSGGRSVASVRSGTGEGEVEFEFPMSRADLKIYVLEVGLTSRGSRGNLYSKEREEAKAFGTKLWESIFRGEVERRFSESYTMAKTAGRGLRIRLHLKVEDPGQGEIADLSDVPWEYLFSTSLDRFLVLSTETPLVRYMDTGRLRDSLLVAHPLNALVMISNPTNHKEMGVSELSVEEEWNRLVAAIEAKAGERRVVLDRLDVASMAGLRSKLRTTDYNILHFIGHGSFDEQSQVGSLLVEDEHGRGKWVPADALVTQLHEHDPLRLVILNSCEGARSGVTSPFSGTAQALAHQGIPAVIAMQFEITDEAAVSFAGEFYRALADGYPVDASLGEARKAISDNNDVEWGTPVLFMRSPDGRIFDVEAGAATTAGTVSVEQPSATPSEPEATVDSLGRDDRVPSDDAKAPAAMDDRVEKEAERSSDANRASTIFVRSMVALIMLVIIAITAWAIFGTS